MKKKSWMAWLVFLASLAAFGCASENNGYMDAYADVLDAHPDETTAGDDCCADRVPDGADDRPAEIVSEVVPEVVPEVVSDIEDTAEIEVPLPNRCDWSGDPDCSVGPGGGYCPDGPSMFEGEVNGAIDATIAAHPEWFDTSTGAPCCPGIYPANVNDYMQGVTDVLGTLGLCATGPGEELGVKYNNECSEAWDIVATPSAEAFLVRRHYVGNCLPAFF